MKPRLVRCRAYSGRRFPDSTAQPFATIIFCCSLLLLPANVRSQSGFAPPAMIQSISGQFTVSAGGEYSQLRYSPAVAADTNLVRLEPALLAVAAEHFKEDLWRELGLSPGASWSGKIFLALRPARTDDDGVIIASGLTLRTWNYRVELPDVIGQARYARALAAVLLLEIANRSAGAEHCAEIPAWLVDGAAQQILSTDDLKVLLSTPARNQDGLPQSQRQKNESGVDALANIRPVLKNSPVLTLEQLSWPTDAQVNGVDGGGYRASAQLFVSELLALPDGPTSLRNFLARLSACRNWQTAFYAAFQDYFRTPLDAEKWWALRVANFTARNAGSRWPAADSCARLAALVSVPVEFRADSNALPIRVEITLQAALRNFTRAQLAEILPVKQGDLQLAQFRLAPPFAALADGYRQVLADFLGGQKNNSSVTGTGKLTPAPRQPANVAAALKQLDALDVRRRAAEGQFRTPAPP